MSYIAPINSIDGIVRYLKKNLPPDSRRMMTGILFAHPDIELSKKEILPLLPRYHVRSDKWFHLFFPGYDMKNSGSSFPATPYKCVYKKNLLFSEDYYNKTRRDLENISKWIYSGGVDLLLVDAIQNHTDHPLDLGHCIDIKLLVEREEGKLPHLSLFFERIFRYAEKHFPNSQTWNFSDSQIPNLVGSLAREALASCVPDNIASDVKRIEAYAVRDFRR
ncbi:MAG: hypothetical protein JXA96_08450 [Sedimentisphaerales bacterium]|nr:hypothetical protein [Sedimentisphaerales bacterium]